MNAVCDYIKARIAVDDRGHDTPCWIWQLSLNTSGYAQGKPPGHRNVGLIHRAAYEAFVGPFPEGRVTDHLCRNRDCVNPEHLEPVTNRENTIRGNAGGKPWSHCKRGHALTPDNEARSPHGRQCRICRNAWQRKNRQALRNAPRKTSGAERPTSSYGHNTNIVDHRGAGL